MNSQVFVKTLMQWSIALRSDFYGGSENILVFSFNNNEEMRIGQVSSEKEGNSMRRRFKIFEVFSEIKKSVFDIKESIFYIRKWYKFLISNNNGKK